MQKSNNQSFEVLALTLKTPESEADAAAVASMLRALVVLVEESQKELGIEATFSIRVNPFREGSLEIPIHLWVCGTAAALFAFNPDLQKVLAVIKSFFEVKKLLKGEVQSDKAAEQGINTGNITINGSNNVINIIQSPRVEDAFDQASRDLTSDESLTGVSLTNKSTGEELANIPRAEFSYFRISENGDSKDRREDRVRSIRTQLTIHSPVLQGNAKWKFVFEGKQISVTIKDEQFLKEVGTGVEAFRNGDRLEVDLDIAERFVDSFADYERTNHYWITKVHGHSSRPSKNEQMHFKLDADR